MGIGRNNLIALLAATVPFIGAARADWPGWRGPNRDGRATETLPRRLPAEAKPAWKLTIGRGYSGPVTASNTLVYVDEQQGSETAHALDRVTGKELWKTAYAKAWSDEFEPGPRCTPLLDGDRVYVQSAQGVVACLSIADGQKLWSIDFKDLGMAWVTERHANVGAAVRRGHTGSPVVDGDRIFLQTSALAGKSIVAVDKFIQATRDSGYNGTASAVAELVDNAAPSTIPGTANVRSIRELASNDSVGKVIGSPIGSNSWPPVIDALMAGRPVAGDTLPDMAQEAVSMSVRSARRLYSSMALSALGG